MQYFCSPFTTVVNDLGEEGRNIGGWHWEEIKALPFVKARLPELFCVADKPLYIDDGITVWVKDIKEVKGEATVTNRKRKIAAFYEFQIRMTYEAKSVDGKTEKGEIHVPDISDENDLDEFVVKVTVKEGSGEGKKAILDKKRADKPLREKMVNLLTGLKQGAGIKFNYGSAEDSVRTSAQSESKKAPTQPAVKMTETKTAPESTSNASSSSTSTCTVTLKEEFLAPPGHIYDCFVDPKRVQIYTNSRAEVNAHLGGHFSLLNGSIEGTFIELEHNKKIVQKWRFSSWPKDVNTTLTLNFEDNSGKTILHLRQTGVPRSDEDRIKAGWRNQFFLRIKGVFHYGSITPY